MQELAGRLTALDPRASESLKVISYFDTLVAGGAGVESLIRAAAMLSGTVAGVRMENSTIRIDTAGKHADGLTPESNEWPISQIGDLKAWLERAGEHHANDAMIVERLALTAAIVHGRRAGTDAGALEIALDSTRPLDERSVAIEKLRLTGSGPCRVTALPIDAPGTPPGRSAVIAGAGGLVRAILSEPGAIPETGPAGHSVAANPESLPQAWESARLALRIADTRHPIVAAADFGVLLDLVGDADMPKMPSHPDVETLLALDARSQEILTALLESGSLRAAAVTLGMHHSSLQARHESLTRQLGYDPCSPVGRARCEVAYLLARLTESP